MDKLNDIIFQPQKIPQRIDLSTDDVPQEILAIRRMETEKVRLRRSIEELFVRQARFLKDYEDNVPFARNLNRYINIYQFFNNLELRAYFSWRTLLRHGSIQPACRSFALLYVNELINQVGCSDALDGYNKLVNFQKHYLPYDDSLAEPLTRYIRDYVIINNLEPSLLPKSTVYDHDHALSVLLHYKQYNTQEVFSALTKLSSYNLKKSKIYKEKAQAVEDLVLRVLTKIADYYSQHYSSPWHAAFLGSTATMPVNFFADAVYCHTDTPSFDYAVSDLSVYHISQGRCVLEYFDDFQLRKRKLSNLLRMIDALLRKAYHIGPDLSFKDSLPWLSKLVENEIATYRNVRQSGLPLSSPSLQLNHDVLERIRENADYTKDRLLTEEEIEEQKLPPKEEAPKDSTLTPTELRYLRCVLLGTDLRWLRSEGLIESLLIDAINEKLFDLFNDTVMDEAGVIEDYRADLLAKFS